MTDDDVAEHGQGHSEPHGHSVTRDDEVGVKEQVDDPAVGVRVLPVGDGDAVEVDGVGQVGHHGQHVGDGQRAEDVVGGRDHVLLRQHNDVHHVTDNPEGAHDDAHVTVHPGIPAVELAQSRGRRLAHIVAADRPQEVRTVGVP